MQTRPIMYDRVWKTENQKFKEDKNIGIGSVYRIRHQGRILVMGQSGQLLDYKLINTYRLYSNLLCFSFVK